MADIIGDGMIKVSFVPTISSTSAPTVAELNAGTALESYITADGDGTDRGTDAVDTTALASTHNTQLPGRRTLSVELTFKNQGDAVAPFSTLAGNATGYLVWRRHVASTTAWTAGQTVEVQPVQAGPRARVPGAANEVLKFAVQFAVTSTPVEAATVAA